MTTTEKLTKELRRLQRDLNSHRLTSPPPTLLSCLLPRWQAGRYEPTRKPARMDGQK